MEPIQFFALLIPLFGVSIPIVAIVTSHLREMAKIKAQQGNQLSEEVRAELREMKSQLAELRETTTKFDLSFDAALTRLEERVDQMERRQRVAVRSGESAEEAHVAVRPGRGAL